MDYILGILTLIFIYMILAISLNLLLGYTGIFSLAHGAVFGVGAYSTAILMQKFGWGFVPSLAAAVAAAGLISIMVALPSLRVSGDFFVVASFGTQVVLADIFLNWTDVTGGAAGIPGIPPMDLFGWTVGSRGALALTCGLFVALVYLAVWLVIHSPFGWLVEAVRQDEVAVIASGRSPRNVKYAVALLSGMIAGVAGALYAVYMSYIDYSNFSLDVSIYMMTLVILGGAGTIAGALAGPVILVFVSEVLNYVDLGSSATVVQQIIYGLVLIVLMFLRPQGLFGRRG